MEMIVNFEARAEDPETAVTVFGEKLDAEAVGHASLVAAAKAAAAAFYAALSDPGDTHDILVIGSVAVIERASGAIDCVSLRIDGSVYSKV